MSRGRPHRRGRAGALLLVAAAVLVGSASVAGPAAAHGQLVAEESTPVEGASISDPLEDLSLAFTEPPSPFAYFAVTAPDGTRVDDDWTNGQPFALRTPVQEYNLVGERWEPVYYSSGFPARVGVAHWPATGAYTVEYASVASDGDAVEGSFAFTYDGPVTPAPPDWTPSTDGRAPELVAALEGARTPGEPVSATGPTAPSGPTGPLGPAAPGAPGAPTGEAADGSAEDGPGLQPAVYVVIGVLVAGAVASVVVAGRRGRSASGPAVGRAPPRTPRAPRR